MRVYTFETKLGFVESYDKRTARRESLEVAKQLKEEVLVTCTHDEPYYKQDWYTAMPDGRFLTDRIGFRADN